MRRCFALALLIAATAIAEESGPPSELADLLGSDAGQRFGFELTFFRFALTPALADQELFTTVRYWEGAVDVEGTRGAATIAGRGYVELTGYAK